MPKTDKSQEPQRHSPVCFPGPGDFELLEILFLAVIVAACPNWRPGTLLLQPGGCPPPLAAVESGSLVEPQDCTISGWCIRRLLLWVDVNINKDGFVSMRLPSVKCLPGSWDCLKA